MIAAKSPEEQAAFLKEVKKVKNKMTKAFKAKVNDIDILKLAEGSISNAAFMFVQLDELQKHISQYGVKDEYKNGENQYGTKKSPEAEMYNSIIRNYTNCISTIRGFIRTTDSGEESDGFDEFIKG